MLQYPGFTVHPPQWLCYGGRAVAVLTLALGIGANTAILSVLDAVLLDMLSVRNPRRNRVHCELA